MRGGRAEDLYPTVPTPGVTSAAARRKGTTAMRAWAVVSETGESRLEELGKHAIMGRTGLPARDLRGLDPALSYTSSILGRERAIVVNLEHVKAIITAAEVLIPKSNQPLAGSFIQDLEARVRLPSFGDPQSVTGCDEMNGDPSKTSWPWPSSNSTEVLEESGFSTVQPSDNASPDQMAIKKDTSKGSCAKILPFEFRALEVCLESACRCLESETLALEREAYPALDELTSKISTLNLDRVRLIKNRLVSITGRVGKVRDELEHLLDDDMDMAEMYLTEKLALQRAGEASSRADDLENADSSSDNEEGEEHNDDMASNSGVLTSYKPNIEELEMLLEAYFVQIDATLNKLSALKEYVDDTDDYIKIMLDDKQNQLLEMGVMLSTAGLIVSAGIVVVSIFGMNIGIDLYDEATPYSKFWETTFGTIGGCAVLYVVAIGWGKKRGLL